MSNDADQISTLYNRIVQMANRFLHWGRNVPIEFLQDENPSLRQLAELADETRKHIHPLLDALDPHQASQAYEYCLLMIQIGEAVDDDDSSRLSALCDQLARKTGTAAA